MKKNIKILSIILCILTSVFLFFSCQQPGNKSSDSSRAPAKTYAIGDKGPSGVGIVFYVTNGGLNGLEAAPSLWNGGGADPTSAWITGGATQTTSNGNTSTAIGTGLANSNAIISQTGETASAAQLCRDYTGGGKNDWFLPSKDELAQLYAQQTKVGGIAASYYWSSSESNATNTWIQNFTSGAQIGNNKSNVYSVRAVRAF